MGLAGNGHLVDWEIYNRPNKGSMNGFSHFAVRVEEGAIVLDPACFKGICHPTWTSWAAFSFEDTALARDGRL